MAVGRLILPIARRVTPVARSQPTDQMAIQLADYEYKSSIACPYAAYAGYPPWSCDVCL